MQQSNKMRDINFLLKGFGFIDVTDLKASTFGFVTTTTLKYSGVFALVKTLFGVDWLFFIAYVALISLEWYTGVKASFKQGKVHESRKLGRMFLKIMIYMSLLFILNSFKNGVKTPVFEGFEINPFAWLYWVVLFVIIWQLLISVLENLNVLGFKWAKKAIEVINISASKKLGIKNGENNDSEQSVIT